MEESGQHFHSLYYVKPLELEELRTPLLLESAQTGRWSLNTAVGPGEGRLCSGLTLKVCFQRVFCSSLSLPAGEAWKMEVFH